MAGLINGLDLLERHAGGGDWSGLSYTFFRDVLQVPTEDLDVLKHSELWLPIVADASATLHDSRALSKYDFRAESFRNLFMPVMLQVGSESPRHFYATDALAAVLPDCRIETLPGQAHEGMTTGPDQYVQSVVGFLKDEAEIRNPAAQSVVGQAAPKGENCTLTTGRPSGGV